MQDEDRIMGQSEEEDISDDVEDFEFAVVFGGGVEFGPLLLEARWSEGSATSTPTGGTRTEEQDHPLSCRLPVLTAVRTSAGAGAASRRPTRWKSIPCHRGVTRPPAALCCPSTGLNRPLAFAGDAH